MKALIASRSAIHRAGIVNFLQQLVENPEIHEVDLPEQAIDFALKTQGLGLAVLELSSCSDKALFHLKIISEAIDPAPVLAVSNYNGRWDAVKALEFGAMGCLNRAASGKETLTALRRILDGEIWVSSKLVARDSGARPPLKASHGPVTTKTASRRGGTGRLSHQQLMILRHLRDGKTNRQIAGLINVSPHTVRYHVSAILRELEVANRTEAAMRADAVIRAYKGN